MVPFYSIGPKDDCWVPLTESRKVRMVYVYVWIVEFDHQNVFNLYVFNRFLYIKPNNRGSKNIK